MPSSHDHWGPSGGLLIAETIGTLPDGEGSVVLEFEFPASAGWITSIILQHVSGAAFLRKAGAATPLLYMSWGPYRLRPGESLITGGPIQMAPLWGWHYRSRVYDSTLPGGYNWVVAGDSNWEYVEHWLGCYFYVSLRRDGVFTVSVGRTDTDPDGPTAFRAWAYMVPTFHGLPDQSLTYPTQDDI